MARRPSMARANFAKYTEITNPLAGNAKTTKEPAGGGNGEANRTKCESNPSVGGDENDVEEDPFGLTAIMSKSQQPQDSEEKGRRDEEEGEEDPFGLGAIITSDTSFSTSSQVSEKSGGQIGRRDDRSRGYLAGMKRAEGPHSSVGSHSTKSPRMDYFSNAHQPGRRSQSEECQQSGRSFLPSTRFEGSRPGYVFQLGPSGLGYYVDRQSRGGISKDRAAVPGTVDRGETQDAILQSGRVDERCNSKGHQHQHHQQQAKPVVDVAVAAQKLGLLLLKPKKAAKAASLLADLMQAEMREDNARLFYRTLRPLAEQPASEAALAAGQGAARAFRLLMERREWVGGVVDGVRTVTWELLFALRHEVRTDDSFEFARSLKRLRTVVEALGDVPGSGDTIDGGGGDMREGTGAEQSLRCTLERKRAVIEIMKEAFKSYHLAWARSSIEPAFKAAADRRRLFPQGELRDALDMFTDAITRRQRNPGGLMAPPSRAVRAHNSMAHPTLNKRSDIIR